MDVSSASADADTRPARRRLRLTPGVIVAAVLVTQIVLVAIDRDSGITHYNLACYLALLQETEMALIHLARAIEIDPVYRELALNESDFDPIRDDPGFKDKTVSVS